MDSTLSQLLQRIVFLETMADALQRRANELEGMNAALEAERDEALAKADPVDRSSSIRAFPAKAAHL